MPVHAAWLGAVTVTTPEVRRSVPPTARALDVDVGEHVTLVAFDPPTASPRPGAGVAVTLYWRARDAVPTAYQVTVQLVPVGADGTSPAGPPAAQHDGTPADGARPTTGWAPGEVVADPHRLSLQADLAAGSYLLIAALYDPNAPDVPRPLVRQDGWERDYVVLERVEVTAR